MGLDPWAVLGLSEDASYQVAHRAYRLRCQLVHPDRHAGARSDVIAEAERSTKELNAAWEQLQDQFASRDTTPRASADIRTGEEALDWLLDAVLSTAEDYGDAVDDRELRYMLRPVRKVQSVGKLDRWFARREPTMLAAIAAGEISEWRACAAGLDAYGIDAVVVMLLDRCLLE